MSSLEMQPVVAGTPLGDRVNALYTDEFPREDKFAFDAMCRFAADGGAEFFAYLDEGEFCGFSYTLKAEKYLFVLYIAMEEAKRSKGYGSRIMKRLADENPDLDLVLGIELPYKDAPNAEQRYRRRDFYERNGFWCTGDVYGVDDDLYLIMTTAKNWDCDDFQDCAKRVHGYLPEYYFGGIYHYADEVRKPL